MVSQSWNQQWQRPQSQQGGSSGSWGGSREGVARQDGLLNPIRAVVNKFSCATCGLVDFSGTEAGGVFCCRRCASGTTTERTCAYATLLYGGESSFVLGAIVLGESLRATGTPFDRVLLHTKDVPTESLRLLGEFWILREVDYISSAPDLHAGPLETARFKDVFTKLQVLNPEAMPYDRVVFLDLDMVILRNLDGLFDLRPPAAMRNWKVEAYDHGPPIQHGQRLEAWNCYFNAGCMVLAPSSDLFNLLRRDVEVADTNWHRSSLAPEQRYLSDTLAGEWSHIDQAYNLEVQLHTGVPLSDTWKELSVDEVAIGHFSGPRKVWWMLPAEEAPVVADERCRQNFQQFPKEVQRRTAVRCQAIHDYWHLTLGSAFKGLRKSGIQVSEPWAEALKTGDKETLGVSSKHQKEGIKPPPSASSSSGLCVGDFIAVLNEDKSCCQLGKVVLARPQQKEGPRLVAYLTPLPKAGPAYVPSTSRFGHCRDLLAGEEAVSFSQWKEDHKDDRFALGSKVMVELGDEKIWGVVSAMRGDDRLISTIDKAPLWLATEDLTEPPANDPELREISELSGENPELWGKNLQGLGKNLGGISQLWQCQAEEDQYSPTTGV